MKMTSTESAREPPESRAGSWARKRPGRGGSPLYGALMAGQAHALRLASFGTEGGSASEARSGAHTGLVVSPGNPLGLIAEQGHCADTLARLELNVLFCRTFERIAL